MPVKAACYYLAIGDVVKTIQLLVLGDQNTLALAIARIFEEEADYVHIAMARKFELEGLYHEALMCLQQLAEPMRESSLLCARFCGSNHFRADFYAKAGLDTKEEYAEKGEQQLTDNQIPQAIESFVLARDTTQALEFGLDHLSRELAKPVYDYTECKSIMDSLQCLDIVHRKSEEKNAVLAYSLYFALQEASWRGYTSIILWIAESLRTIIESNDLQFAVPIAQIRFQAAQYLVAVNPELGTQVCTDIMNEKETPPKVKAGCQALLKTIQQYKDEAVTLNTSENCITPAGSQLPVGNVTNSQIVSIISKQAIQNGGHVLLEDFASHVSEEEFLMMVQVFPYSVLLNGKRANRHPPQDTSDSY